ncbi:cellulose biosynthesis protein BcsD [Gluconacetobacter tumulisoli]|uniref:Cellulose synthase n=1 Tax=Gluconacetobacter tumulisoli TaxID=1286189 RepID=A0A7W4K501_9PROT|nr:cellulose biosynthesis protein BcsD [Gluconacetobacter tumulisoli]MBB2200509.1 cellulose synthase [Gluconacetobacter tumulisoli]
MSADLTLFMREFARAFDEQAGAEARDRFLRAVGARMADRLVLPPCTTIEAMEHEMNALLALVGWGRVSLALDRGRQVLQIRHAGLPTLGGLGAPAGYWLAACLAGVYETWIGRQPDGTGGCAVTWRPDQPCEGDVFVMEYGSA